MESDLSKEVKELIIKFRDKGFRYAKPIEMLTERINTSKQEIEKEIINSDNLKFVEKQYKENEIRYVLYHVYSNKIGKVYVITFEDKIVVITAFPIGKTTLRRYRKRFKP